MTKCGQSVLTTGDPANYTDRILVQLHQPRRRCAGRRAWEERRLVSARLISFDLVCRPITTQLEGIYATTSAESRIGVIAPVPALVRWVLHRHVPEPGIF